MAISNGPANRAVCRMLNQRSCGTGTICGRDKGGSFVMTNAHVVGTEIGRQVRVQVESLGMRSFTGTVIRAAYSNRVIADWAVVYVPGLMEVDPVFLSKNPPAPNESMYTKGFPHCDPHDGTDVTQHETLPNGVLLWQPDAIPGQSGSGVIGDLDHIVKAVLTWSWTSNRRKYGAGMLTSEIYRQNLSREIRAFPMMPGLRPLDEDFNMSGIDTSGLDDPTFEEGFFSTPVEMGIQDLPIWYEDQVQKPPVDPGTGDTDALRREFVNSLRRISQSIDDEIGRFEGGSQGGSQIDPNKPDVIDDLFGLG